MLQLAESQHQAGDAAFQALLRSGAQTTVSLSHMRRLPNLGDAAYLDGTGSATLLVRRGRSAVRLHVGGCGGEEACRDKSVSLATIVLKNLQAESSSRPTSSRAASGLLR